MPKYFIESSVFKQNGQRTVWGAITGNTSLDTTVSRLLMSSRTAGYTVTISEDEQASQLLLNLSPNSGLTSGKAILVNIDHSAP